MPGSHQKVTPSILESHRFSLLSQLLDDLNDREIDKLEGNHTIFTGDNYIPEIKTLLYIFEIRDFLLDKKYLTVI